MMRMRLSTFLVLPLSVACLLVSVSARADVTMPHSVVGSGGGEPSNETYSMNCTVSQALIGEVSSPSNINEIGFWYLPDCFLAGLEGMSNLGAARFWLSHGSPNPFAGMARVHFSVPRSCDVTLKLFDVTGRNVRTLVEDNVEPGFHMAVIDGAALCSGVYFCRMEAEDFVATSKLIYLR